MAAGSDVSDSIAYFDLDLHRTMLNSDQKGAYLADLERFAKIISDYLISQVFSDGNKKSYSGNIPLNLDAPFNFGEKASEICHPQLASYEISQISWMQLLTNLKFCIIWQDGFRRVLMCHRYEIFNVVYAAKCQSSIKIRRLQLGIENLPFKIIRALLHDVFRIIMVNFTNHQAALDSPPERVGLEDDLSLVSAAKILCGLSKRKRDEVEPLDALSF